MARLCSPSKSPWKWCSSKLQISELFWIQKSSNSNTDFWEKIIMESWLKETQEGTLRLRTHMTIVDRWARPRTVSIWNQANASLSMVGYIKLMVTSWISSSSKESEIPIYSWAPIHHMKWIFKDSRVQESLPSSTSWIRLISAIAASTWKIWTSSIGTRASML